MSNPIDYDCLLGELNETNAQFKELFVEGRTFPSIFFFGNPENAVAATIGVNPSFREFSIRRKWKLRYDANELIDRCRRYFESPLDIPPYPWFEGWETVLRKIGLSYYKDPRAVHFDISPRATRLMREFQSKEEIELFLSLCQNDLKYLIRHLREYPRIKHLYTAGSITKRYYIIEFLRKFAEDYSLTPVYPFRRGGRGKLALYKMDLTDGVERYLLFSSTCPSSASGRKLLIQKVPMLKKDHPNFVSNY